MAKSAEKLIILGDLALGLLSRLYNLISYPRPQVFTPELEKVVKTLIKKFPEFPLDLNKIQGMDLFNKKASELTTTLSDYYLTYLDILNFSEETWKLLVEMSATVTEFKFELNVDLMTYFFNLMIRYIQIHILMERIPEPQFYIASYAKAYQITAGTQEPSYLKIAAYLTKFKQPFRKLQEEFAALGLCVGNTLMTFLPIINKWSNIKTFVDNRIFNVLDEPKTMTVPAGERNYLELLHLDKFRTWVLFGFLVCPSELARPGALDLLKLCLKENFVMTVFRDQVFNIHDEYYQLFEWFTNGKFKLSKYTKTHIKEAYKDYAYTLTVHQDLRTFLRVEMETLLSFFTEFPGCLPPKIQMVFALTHLARDEINWYFQHIKAVPWKSSKFVFPVDPKISYLIYYLDQFWEMIKSRKLLIQTYYVEFLQTTDTQLVHPAVEQFKTLPNQLPIIQFLVPSVLDNLRGKTTTDSYEAIRLNWYRTSAALTDQRYGIPSNISQALSQAMAPIVLHSRNVDCIDSQCISHCSLSNLFWYKNELLEMLKQVLRLGEGQPAHCLSFIKILDNSLQNVHRVCPEELPLIGREAVTLADTFLRTIITSLERLLAETAKETEGLRKQTSNSAALARMAEGGQRPSPGFESLYENRKYLQVVKSYRKSIAEIVSAIAAVETITVYNIQFVPREYLLETIGNTLRTSLRQLTIVNGNLNRPSYILKTFRDIMYSYQIVERNCNINMNDICRDVLLSELGTDTDVDFPAPEQKKEDRPIPLVHSIATWYYNLFSRDLSDIGISYSPLRNCFISRAVPQTKGANPSVYIDIENFTDVNELRCLVTLVGPAGVKVIDKALMKIVSRHVKNIKDILAQNAGALNGLVNRFTEQSVWLEQLQQFQHLDALVQQTTVIGCTLVFRQLLYSALGDITRQRVPFVNKAVALSFRHFHDQVKVDVNNTSLDLLAFDLGLDVGEADHIFRNTVAKYKTQLSDITLFNLLPELYAVSFASQRWKVAEYQIEQEGHINNAHTMAVAIKHLILGFQRIPVKADLSQMDVDKRIQQDFERFLRCSAFSLLHMHAINVQHPNQPQFSIPSAVVFLEQFIAQSCGRLSLSNLEDCLPYTLFRTNYIQMYEKQTSHSYAPVADDDNF